MRISISVRVVTYLILLTFAVTTAIPFLWMLSASFKPREEVESLHFVPKEPQPENYLVVMGARNPKGEDKPLNISFGKWYFNSIFIAAWVTVLQTLTSAFAAYAFSRIEWPGRDKVFLLYLGTMMIPGLVLMVPRYEIMYKLGWLNSYVGLIVPASFSAFGTFLLRQFMLTIPKSFDQAAEIDGANHWQIFWDVIMPLTRPGLITLAIFTFMGNYRSFFWPLVMIKDDWLRTLPVGMLSFQSQYGPQVEYLMAASVMCIIPMVVVFVVFQRFLVKGIQLGALQV